MDQTRRAINYITLVKNALRTYRDDTVQHSRPSMGHEMALIFDDEHQHYLVRNIGWHESKRDLLTILHVAIRNGKVWIEEDWTEEGIATYFLEHGIPNDQIVLGFQAPHMRPYTDFAVG
ncbi:MAG: XisI protein [Chloroflexota bacterium]